MKYRSGYHKLEPAEPLVLDPKDWTAAEWEILRKLFRVPMSLTDRVVLHVDTMEFFFGDAPNPTVDDQRTYTVTEWCPHCESEVEMRWNTDSMGFKAFCPVCGKRLMLCDECRHSGEGPCDYDSETDSCRHNPPAVHPEIPSALRVDTPLGALLARVQGGPDYPGIYIDIRRPDADQDLLLALVEFTATEADLPETGCIISRVYGDALADEYTDRVVHENIDEYFRVEEVENL